MHKQVGPAQMRVWSGLRRLAEQPILPTLAMALASLILLAIAYAELHSRQTGVIADRLAVAANSQAMRVRERIASYALVLRSASALFATRGDVNRAEWQTFVSGLKLYRDYPGVLGVGYARKLTAEGIAEHEMRARAEGLVGYRVWPRPPDSAAMMAAIAYLEPANWRNLRAFGYDMFTEPTRREAMLRALHTGGPALSAKLTLVQETDTDVQAGVLLYLPIFSGAGSAGFDPDTSRDEELVGWVYCPFRMGELIDGALGQSFAKLRLRIYDDVSEESAGRLLFDSLARDTAAQPVVASYATPMLIHGRVWRLRFDAAPGFVADAASIAPDMLALGLMFTLLTFGTWVLFSVRRRAVTMMRLSESLRVSEERYSVLVNLSRDGVAAVDGQLRFTFVNPRLAEWLAVSPEALVGRSLGEVCKQVTEADCDFILDRLREGEGLTYETLLHGQGAKTRVVLVSDHPVFDSGGAFRGATVMFTDITDRKASEERIRFLATHDMLTELPNRFVVHDRVEQALGLARRYGSQFAVFFVDIDHFKEVNDSYGHAIGDQVLREVVQRIRDCLRDSDTLGRMGGDEFVVLLPQIESRQAAINVANKIVGTVFRPMRLEQIEVTISVSIGLATCPDDGMDEKQLLRRADAAMYRVKQEGRNSVAAFDERID